MRTDGPIFITQPFQYMRFARAAGPDELIPENLAKFVWGDVDPEETDPLKVTDYFRDGFLKRQLTLSSIYMESMRDQAFIDAVTKSLQYFPYYEHPNAISAPWMELLRAATHFNISVYSFEGGNEEQAQQFLTNAIETFDGVEEHSGSEANQYYNFLGAALEALSRMAGVPFTWDRPGNLDSSNVEVPNIISQFCRKLESGEIKHTEAKWGSNAEHDALAVALDLKRRGQYAASLHTYADGLAERDVVSFDTLRGMYKTTVAATYVVSALQLLVAARRSRESSPDYKPITWNTSSRYGEPYRPFQEDFENFAENMRSPSEAMQFMRSVSGNSQFELLRPIQVVMDEWNGPLGRSIRQELQFPRT